MSIFEEVRIGDLDGALIVKKGFPTFRAAPEGEVPVLSVAALRNETSPKRFVDYDAIEVDALGQAGDVLLAVEGGTVGETFAVPHNFRYFVPSQQAATLRVTDQARIDHRYLGAWMATEQAREQIRRLARGTGIRRVAFSDLATLTIKLPPIQRQQEIGRRFDAFEAALRAHRAVIAGLEELRDVDLVAAFASIGSEVAK